MFAFQVKQYGINKQKAIILLAGWGSRQRDFWVVAKILRLHGFTVVVYTYDTEILSPHISATVKNFTEVKNDITQKISQLKKIGYDKISIFGTSLGSLLAFMAANSSKEVEKVIINLTGADVAEIAWSWDMYKPYFKQELLENGVTLASLKKQWATLSPINNMQHLQNKKLLLFGAEHDEVIPYDQFLQVVDSLHRYHYEIDVNVNNSLTHFNSAVLNLLQYNRYTNFLKSK